MTQPTDIALAGKLKRAGNAGPNPSAGRHRLGQTAHSLADNRANGVSHDAGQAKRLIAVVATPVAPKLLRDDLVAPAKYTQRAVHAKSDLYVSCQLVATEAAIASLAVRRRHAARHE